MFLITDLPINYNEFHEAGAGNVTAFATHLKFMNFGKSQVLNINIFHHDDYINKCMHFFVKNIQVKPLTFTKNS